MKCIPVLAAAFLLCACSSAVVNDPLKESRLSDNPVTVSEGGYRTEAVGDGQTSDEVLVILAASGGGKRSAAYSYGVLRGLRDFKLDIGGREHSLLDELGTYAAVSGGSFPAAYYGLYRDRIFTDFENDFLKVDLDSYVAGVFLLPWRWTWMVSPRFGTNDEMAKIYDKLLFHGATFADLEKKGKPVISINATDINYGTVFSFTQDHFDLICSDLSTYPIANAVAASNGFPILFTPITLTSYAAQCGNREPAWVKRADVPGAVARQRQLVELARLYLDPNKTKYVHLMDGGIADNLAMRFTIEKALAYAQSAERIRALHLDRVRRILLISADGQATRDTEWPRKRNISSLRQIFSSVSGSQIDSYNFETLILADSELQHFVDVLKTVRCAEGRTIDGHACGDVQGFFAHLALSDVSDMSVREKLLHIPTDLTIPYADVERLVEVGEQQVHGSDVLKAFRDSLR